MALGERFYFSQPASVDALGTGEPAVLYEASGVNVAGALRWFQIHQSVGIPPNGSVPVYTFPVQDLQIISFAPPGPPGDQGRRFDVGVIAVWSTTQDTLTNAGNTGPINMSGRFTT